MTKKEIIGWVLFLIGITPLFMGVSCYLCVGILAYIILPLISEFGWGLLIPFGLLASIWLGLHLLGNPEKINKEGK